MADTQGGEAPQSPAERRQTEIYLSGLTGNVPEIPADFPTLETRAEAAMTEDAFAYFAGGAGVEGTAAANRDSLDRWRIIPRMLRDVSERDLSVTLFGTTLPSPFLLAPVGVLELAWEDGDRATARAAASEGVPMVISNQASASMEQIAEAMGDAPRWFQLYWSRSRDLVASFVRRAEACGCSAIVVTLDTPLLGWRPRDLNRAHLPFLRNLGLAQYTSDPVFHEMLGKPPAEAPEEAVQLFVRTYSNPSVTWDDLGFLREHTRLPIVLKGIIDPEDGARAVDAGVDGIVVSNHGGRQVDGALGAADALPGVVGSVGGQIPVLFDSGIRGGADAFKVLGLGADAVLLGRPYAYGLALAGEDGVRTVIRNMKADFELTMALAGRGSVDEIDAEAMIEVG